MIALSENYAVVSANTSEPLSQNEVNIPLPSADLVQKMKEAASVAPPPVSNIYWFWVNTKILLS